MAGVLSEPVPIVEAMRRVAREAARAFGADMAGSYALDAARQVSGRWRDITCRGTSSASSRAPFAVELFDVARPRGPV